MSNLFGVNPPIIYVDDTPYQLPSPVRGGRDEDFPKEIKSWIDLDDEIHERIKGYRLETSYEYEFIENDDLEDLITIYNAISTSSNIKLKFQTLPRHYPIIVKKFKIDKGSGYSFTKDSAKISFIGKTLIDAYPNPDNVYTLLILRGKGSVIKTLTEQGV